MECCRAYVVVNEGASEKAYIQQLRSFLMNRLPILDDLRPRFDLIPRVTNNGEGGGQFSLVRRTYEKCLKADRHAAILVWVDVDIYIRGDSASERRNAEAYAQKGGIPDFYFSVMNFEDFLALHFEDDFFEKWFERMSAAGHFRHPLHGKDYAAVFAPIWAEYASCHGYPAEYLKGDLPVDFISHESLSNLIRHVRDPRIIGQFRTSTPTTTETFAEFLSENLLKLYPDVFQ